MKALLHSAAQRFPKQSLRIAVISNFTGTPLEIGFRDLAEQLDLTVEIISERFELASGQNLLNSEAKFDLVAVLIDFESVGFESLLEAEVSDLQTSSNSPLPLLINQLQIILKDRDQQSQFLIAPLDVSTQFAADNSTRRRALFVQLESELKLLESKYPNVRTIDVQTKISQVGLRASFSERGSLQAQSPLSMLGVRTIAETILSSYLFSNCKPLKALFLDADNTLWKGEIGESSVGGVEIHPTSYPGSVYWKVQKLFKDLKKSGYLLILLTKNDAERIHAHFETYKEQPLSLEDFVITSCNWLPKPDRVTSILNNLNLGFDSALFIDDSAVEIMAMQQRLPEVLTIQVPSNLSSYLNQILEVHEFLQYQGSELNRTELYGLRARTSDLRRISRTHEEFLQQLGTNLLVRHNQDRDLLRIVEMANRTNQFNSTKLKLSTDEMYGRLTEGTHQFWAASVTDVLGDSGTSLAAASYTNLSQLVVSCIWISCRVLGRELENGFVASIAKFAQENGQTELVLQYKATERNHQVREFLLSLDPIAVSKDSLEIEKFMYNTSNLVSVAPAHITIVNQ